MSRKKASSGSNCQKAKPTSKNKNNQAQAQAANMNSWMPALYNQQLPYFQQPQSNVFSPYLPAPPAMQFAPSAQFANSLYPQMGMAEMPFYGQQQPTSPYFFNNQFMPQPLQMPFLNNMCANPLPPSSIKTQKCKKKEESSSSSSSSESEDDTKDEEASDNDPCEIIQGSSKNCGAIYKPGKSKADDIDNEGGVQEKGNKKEATGKTNSRKGSLNKATLAKLRLEAAQHYESQKNDKNKSTKAKNSKGSTSASAAAKRKVKAEKDDFSEESSEGDIPEKTVKKKK